MAPEPQTLTGGDGDDTYVLDDASDTLVEGATAVSGLDTIESSISYALLPNFERLILLGTNDLTGTGSGVANFIGGNSGNNILIGNGGNDILDGGLGADTLQGGAGDDSYIIDNINDVVIDVAGAKALIPSQPLSVGPWVQTLKTSSSTVPHRFK